MMQRDSCLGSILFGGRSVECNVSWPTMDLIVILSSIMAGVETGIGKKMRILGSKYCEDLSKSGCFQIN